jgi:hypothetical protein
MEKQLESLTELVKELTRERNLNEQQLSTRTGFYKGRDNVLIFFFSTVLSSDEGQCPLGYQLIFT